MGFFKKIGNKLKRVISIKNITRAATGQFGAIGKDVLRVASTEDPKEVRAKQAAAAAKGQTYTPAPVKVAEMPKEIEVILDSEGQTFKKNLLKQASDSGVVQDASSFAINTALLAYWKKYRAWLIGLLFALIMFFSLRWVFKKSSRSGKSRR